VPGRWPGPKIRLARPGCRQPTARRKAPGGQQQSCEPDSGAIKTGGKDKQGPTARHRRRKRNADGTSLGSSDRECDRPPARVGPRFSPIAERPATACWTPTVATVANAASTAWPGGPSALPRPPSRSVLRECDSRLGPFLRRHRRPRWLRTGADRTDRAALLRLSQSTIHPPIGVLFRFDRIAYSKVASTAGKPRWCPSPSAGGDSSGRAWRLSR
jgi:hypothetical protein